MITVRKGDDRGHFDHGWLKTWHTFSFGAYHDPRHEGFRVLRVINEDYVAPGEGFGTHPHRDMEILTYVIAGAVEHRDSMGTGSVIRPGDVQRMTAGSGVTHSEFNPSDDETLHLLQIWIRPARTGATPGYDQRHFSVADRADRLRLVASPDGADGSLTWGQDVRLFAAVLSAGAAVTHTLAMGRHAWVQVVRGELDLEDRRLAAGDGAAVSDEAALTLIARSDAEVLVFDLP